MKLSTFSPLLAGLCLLSTLSWGNLLHAREGAPDPVATAVTEPSGIERRPTSVVRVNVTNQQYDFFRPWSKRPPYQRSAIGAILPGNQVLVTGELVANATYLELEKPDGSGKTPARLEVVDYEANLALIKPVDEAFLEGFKPLALAESAVGEQLHVWQLERNGDLLSTSAVLTNAEVSRYPTENAALLLYRLTSALQPRDGSFTTPVVRQGRLTGMIQRFDPRTQNVDIIPAPVIEHFLQSAKKGQGGYKGFPKVGLGFADLRDPQLRRFVKLPANTEGVYLTDILKGGPAERAGIQNGDLLLAVDGKKLDQDGLYEDERYGKLSLIHLLSTRHYDGEKIPFLLLRDGKELTVEVTLEHPDASRMIIEPYTIDKAPRYQVVGGLVLQELSRQYLREWGADWSKKAPERFVYYDTYQQSLFRDDPRQRIVVLSQVLPSPCTIGYEQISGVEVTEINGVKLLSLDDVDKALAAPVDGFHRFKLEEEPGELILDAKEVAAIEAELLRAYGLPSAKQL